MARVTPLAFVVALSALSLGAPLVAQIQSLPAPPAPAGQTRDPVPPASRGGRGDPGVRRIPVGTASISGVVAAADTGRPIAGAQVMLNGMTAFAAGRIGGSAGTIPGGISGGASIGVGGSGGVVTFNSLSQIPSGVSRTMVTDTQGQFSFQRLPAGQFTLNVNRSQFLSASYGQKRPGAQGKQIQLADGQQLKLSMPMMRGGVVSGMVLGENGEPQTNARITAWRFNTNEGARRLGQANGTSTDDRGQYRLFNLQPGDYLISATTNGSEFALSSRMSSEMQAIEQAIASGAIEPPAAPGLPATVTISVQAPPPPGPIESPPGYLPTFYPGTIDRANGSTIHINAGEERSGVDIQVQLVHATNIVGSVSGAVGPGLRIQLALLSDDPQMAQGYNSTGLNQDGKFSFRDISPGKYTVLALTVPAPQMTMVNGVPVGSSGPPRQDDSQRLWGRAVVTVDGQPTVSADISLQPARSISGVVVFEMERVPDLSRSRYTVVLNTAAGSPSFSQPPQAQVGVDGRFTLNGVVPGKYNLRVGANMKSAIVEGQDTLDFPFEVTGDRDIGDAVLTVTDKSTEISGTLTDAAGKPAVDYMIIAAAADTRYWTPGSRRVITARPAIDGRYMFRALPPGDYLVAAVTDLDPGGQFDPEFLKTLEPASMRIKLAEGAKIAQDLRIGR